METKSLSKNKINEAAEEAVGVKEKCHKNNKMW